MRLGIALGVSMALGLFSGCGEQALSPSCTRDCEDDQECAIAYDCSDEADCGFSQICVDKCENDSDCRAGHLCVRGVCSALCIGCPAGQECSTPLGSCIGSVCTDSSCASGSYCDSLQDSCYLRSGSCAKESCRQVPALLRPTMTIVCEDDKLCHARQRRVTVPADADVPTTIEILEPTPGQLVSDQDPLTFHWRTRPNPVILSVGTEPPANLELLDSSAIWGDARDARVVKTPWSRGVKVTDGHWGGAPGLAPPATVLYLLIQEVKDGKLLGMSKAVPFAVEKAAWLADGAACVEEGKSPGDCPHPTEPRMCVDSACRRLCESDADCDAPTRCGLPLAPLDVRVCGVN